MILRLTSSIAVPGAAKVIQRSVWAQKVRNPYTSRPVRNAASRIVSENNCFTGKFIPSRYNSSRAKCIQCVHCQQHFSPNKFIFHSHKLSDSIFSPANAANFNSWRRHVHLIHTKDTLEGLIHAWEDVKAMFNGGSRRRVLAPSISVRKHVRPRPISPLAETGPASPPTPHYIQPALSSVPQATTLPLMSYAPLLNPATPFFPYDWLCRHQQQAEAIPYNLWLQGMLQRRHDIWPWNPVSTMALPERREDVGWTAFRTTREPKKDKNHQEKET